MHRTRNLLIAVQVATFLLLAGPLSRARSDQDGQSIFFTVSMSKPQTHLLEVEMRFRDVLQEEAVLVMPVWTPGSYLIREFERHVQDFAASDESGHPLAWEKINKNSWRVKTNGAREWRATYRVYANELSVRTNELNSDHAFWNNAALLMYPDRFIHSPSFLHINPAPDWKIATGLPPVAGEKNTFRAENFDVLYDSPVECSNFKQIDFTVRGVPHRIVIDGEGNYDPVRMRNEVQKIVEAEVAMMGEIPYHDYTFILHLRSNTGGGLEHLNSTALGSRRNSFATDEGYQSFAALVAHEFFHVWNVKRIRPDALGPFDYTKENYTRLLWVAEGITEYYGRLMSRRAGVVTDQIYLDKLATRIQTFQETPGRLEMSAEEASFDAWIKLYRPDENSINSSISYYDKGEILGLLLDLDIRRRTHNAKSLDDVMRYLYSEFFKQGRNYTPADFQKACELMAGASLDQFFARYVRGRDDLETVYGEMLAGAGLRLETTGPGGPKAFLGADLSQTNDRLTVTNVRAGSPAYEQGLNGNDQIVALDGDRVTKETFEKRIDEKKPGDTVRIAVFRFDELRTIEIRLGSSNSVPFRIAPISGASDEQKRIYQSWLDAH